MARRLEPCLDEQEESLQGEGEQNEGTSAVGRLWNAQSEHEPFCVSYLLLFQSWTIGLRRDPVYTLRPGKHHVLPYTS